MYSTICRFLLFSFNSFLFQHVDNSSLSPSTLHTQSEDSDNEKIICEPLSKYICMQDVIYNSEFNNESLDTTETYMKPMEESSVINIGIENAVKEVKIGSSLSPTEHSMFISLFKEYVDVCAWSYIYLYF